MTTETTVQRWKHVAIGVNLWYVAIGVNLWYYQFINRAANAAAGIGMNLLRILDLNPKFDSRYRPSDFWLINPSSITVIRIPYLPAVWYC